MRSRAARAGLLLIALLATPTIGEAQTPPKTVRIGMLSPLSPAGETANDKAFRAALRDLGYIEGQNTVIEARYADGQPDRLPALAADLVRSRVDVIVAWLTPAVRAAQQATTTVPIVMAFAGDPIGERFIAELPRPGGNITGISTAAAEIARKRVELLKTVDPHLSRVAHLASATTTQAAMRETEIAGRALGVPVTTLFVRDVAELPAMISGLKRSRTAGVVVALSVQPHWKSIVDLALRHRLATVSGPGEFVELGGLLAYGPAYADLFRRAAVYVDKILKGARPTDLPVEQPTRYELRINSKTARALGLTIPQSLLLRADHIIE
jgi:putative ABC transport system substrate-binding protein